MLGAIIGDIIGSPYEFHNIKNKDFELFCDYNHFTDDTILTCATAEWLLSDKKPDIKWNFTKFLVDKNGKVVERFEPTADMKAVETKIAELL